MASVTFDLFMVIFTIALSVFQVSVVIAFDIRLISTRITLEHDCVYSEYVISLNGQSWTTFTTEIDKSDNIRSTPNGHCFVY
jgi:hypothetical protein